MAIDPTSSPSRRALLSAVIGAGAATVASALGRPFQASAADGETVLVGGEYDGTSPTKITNTTTGQVAIWGESTRGVGIHGASSDQTAVRGHCISGRGVHGTGGGVGVHGDSLRGVGIRGISEGGNQSFGVLGSTTAGTGVCGYSFRDSISPIPPQPEYTPFGPALTGVYGFVDVRPSSPEARGVYGFVTAGEGVRGQSNGGGIGVAGYSLAEAGNGIGAFGQSGSPTGVGVKGTVTATTGAPMAVLGTATSAPTGIGVRGTSSGGVGVRGDATSGVGLYGTATTGYALRTVGRVKLEKASGVAIIAAATTSVIVSPGIDVTSASFVLLTPKADIGTRRLWYTTDPAANTVTIRISSGPATALSIGWLLLG